MNILIGILPAFLWGVGPIMATKIGGKPINQLLGTCYGQLIIGILIYLFSMPKITLNDFIWVFLGGLAWSFAQLTQFMSFEKMNVSTAMPISTGLQLIEIPLAGVIFWGDWGTPLSKLIGFISIGLLVIGICSTSYSDKKTKTPQLDFKAGLMLLVIGSFGYAASSVFPKIPDASGLVGILPQSIGMGIGGILLGSFMQRKQKKQIMFSKKTLLAISIGIFGGLGNLAYLSSLQMNGIANAFPLTQLNVVVSTLGSLLILHETKNKKELSFTVIGLIIIIISSLMISRLN